MILEKYSRAPFEFDPERVYAQGGPRGDKPTGFWVSVKGEDDWPSWCEGEGWNLDGLKHRYEVELADGANILLLSTPQQIRDFHAKYKQALPYTDRFEHIDWAHVAEKYDGIIIAPYQWTLRLDMSVFWFYGWDCASGCIWNLDAIKGVTPVLKAIEA